MKTIIDISKHQGDISFSLVAPNIDGVIIRAGLGWTGETTDTKWNRNITGFEGIGKPIGVYWFSYAYTIEQARTEAARCLELVRNHKIDLPIFYDWEYDSYAYATKHGITPTKDLITAMIDTFCSTIKSAGYKAGFYFNEDYHKNYINVELLRQKYYTWYARYSNIATPNYDLWQYTSTGKIPGITGNVDISYLVNPILLAMNEPTSEPVIIPVEDPTPVHKTNDEIASEVIAGLWGNGLTRARKLKAAGYSYIKIQNLVNKKIRANKRKV